MAIDKWDLWIALVPFDDIEGAKKRPVLVLGEKEVLVFCGKLTTHAPRASFPYEYVLQDWKGAGLAFATTLRMQNLIAVPRENFICRIGSLQPVDMIEILRIIKSRQEIKR